MPQTSHVLKNAADWKMLLLWWAVYICIPLLSYFGRPLQRFSESVVERGTISTAISALLIGLVTGSIILIIRRHGLLYALHLLWLVPVLVFIHLGLPNFVERIHFALFGLFGFLSLRLFPTAAALSLYALISILDEVFQWVLPDRVGDIRDVFFNLTACLIGAAVAWIAGKQS